MYYPPHLPLEQRKILSARLLYWDAVEPFSIDAQIKAQKEFDYLKKKFLEYLDLRASQLPEETRLDVFVKDIIEGFVTLARHEPIPTHILNKVLPTLQKGAQRISCDVCHSKCVTGTICNGSSDDDLVVHQAGLCIRPLREIFEFTQQVTDLYYRHYASVKPSFPTVAFSTLFVNKVEKIHDFPVKYYVSGLTEYPRQSASATQLSQVQLQLNPGILDALSYLASPYVLFHECIAHSFSDITSIDAVLTPRPAEFSARESFGEGWMDSVAMKVMEEVCTGTGHPARHLYEDIPFPQDCLNIGKDFHLKRKEWRGEGVSRNSKYIKRGDIALENFLNLLQHYFRIREEEKRLEILYCLSFNLNMLADFDSGLKTDFITAMKDLPARGKPKTPQQSVVADIVANYLRNNDIQLLLRGVSAYCSTYYPVLN